ncbi:MULTISPECIES: hypothetical protein [Sporosarcina]|uniref:Fur-regulated basic protein B n=1 Tax=Sporosarcina contaminans TaxID=633403 RepID=A0ABW3TZW0_9BACL
MIQLVEMYAIIKEHRQKTTSRRKTSGELRVQALRKENERLNRQ